MSSKTVVVKMPVETFISKILDTNFLKLTNHLPLKFYLFDFISEVPYHLSLRDWDTTAVEMCWVREEPNSEQQITFETLLDEVGPELRTALLFHLDLFVGG